MIALLLAATITTSLPPGVIVRTDSCNEDGCTVGMLCPINARMAYTAMHVLQGAKQAVWENQYGEQHALEIVDKVIKDKDGAVLVRSLNGDFPVVYPTGKAPKVGERLYWQGRGWYAEKWYVDEGLYYGLDEEGDMTFGRGAHPGMSGGCVLNEQQESVGVLLGTTGLGALAQSWGVPPRVYGAPIWRK